MKAKVHAEDQGCEEGDQVMSGLKEGAGSMGTEGLTQHRGL